MGNKILISVLMPLYNASLFVQEAIESVLCQSYTDWELVIVDDGSTDGSLELVRTYESDKVRVYAQPNRGACVARNKGLKEANGRYVKFLDADDVLSPDCLLQQINQMKELECHQIPFGDYDFIDEKGNRIFSYKFDLLSELNANQILFFFRHWEILISTPLHRTDTLLAIGGFDEKLRRGQESDLHFRLALHGVQFVYKTTLCFNYRSHNQATRISRSIMANDNVMFEYQEYRLIKIESLISGTRNNTAEFQKSFFQWRFDKARRLFVSKQIEEGKMYLKQAEQYTCKTKFFTTYRILGKFFGYANLEAIFQWRLKYKVIKPQELTGIGKYV